MKNDVQTILAWEEIQQDAKLRGLSVCTEEYQGRFEVRDTQDNDRLIAVCTTIRELSACVMQTRDPLRKRP